MSQDTANTPQMPVASEEDSLIVEIVWHDNQWRGACRDPLANQSCLDNRFYIWEERGHPELINARKPTVCGNPDAPGRCTESQLFLTWRWPRWPNSAPTLSRRPPFILFVTRKLGPGEDGDFYFSGFYTPERIEPDPDRPKGRIVHGVPEKSSWFSPQVQIPLQDYAQPSNRMALKGTYIPTLLARQILEAEAGAHRRLLNAGGLDPAQQHEIGEIARRIERALWQEQPVAGANLANLESLLRTKGQVILAGPPGVGKTYQARRLVSRMLNLDPDDAGARNQHQLGQLLRQRPALRDDLPGLAHEIVAGPAPHGVWDIVQFHPSYAYEDFVRGIQAEAEAESGALSFRPVNRLLGLLAELAGHLGPTVPVVLIVDEINRGDLAKVLGELIYALEYRDETVITPYAVGGRPGLKIPGNFYLIGTMNTADRAIALVDYAIRRRFSFVHLPPEREVVAGHYTDAALRERALELYDQVQALFTDIGAGYVAEDLAVGHSYFMARGAAELATKVAFELAPLLVEYHKEGILTVPPELDLDGTIKVIKIDPFALEQKARVWLGVE